MEVIAGDEHIIFDMGSGLRELGQSLIREKKTQATCFLSHYHWDHIVGLPFFGLAYDPNASLVIYGATRMGKSVREILAGQMINPYFPVSLGEMRAQLLFRGIENNGMVQIGPAVVTAKELSHPGGALGFRVDSGKASVVYATDFEHGTPADEALIELSKGADVLIFDATYTDDEYHQGKRGWGHSTWQVGTRIAKAAGVKRLVLFHHDPAHDDREIDAIVKAAREEFPATDGAKEGKTYHLPLVKRPVVRKVAKAAKTVTTKSSARAPRVSKATAARASRQ